MATGKTLAANRAARNAAPVVGTYICDDHRARECPCRPDGRGSLLTGGARPEGISRQLWGQHHCYHESTRRRLEWQHGENRVDQADIARWNALGTRKAVAA